MDVSMRDIEKSFGSNNVLNHVDFALHSGEVCALLGENGAGKSTLMNILGGVLPADAGFIALDGRLVEFHSPVQSLGAGIAFIHQELNLLNDLPIYENMFIGRELKNALGFLRRREMIDQTQRMFEEIGVSLDSTELVSSLDVSYKQIVEIARALMMRASVMIMDEPTSALSNVEIARLFEIIRTLKKKGVSIIFISHKLPEVMEICDRYVVLRDGVVVAKGSISDVTMLQLAEYMVGHVVRTTKDKAPVLLGKTVLRLENLTLEPLFRNISLDVHAGEVLGVTGLLGDGRSELFRTVFGDMGKYRGNIYYEGNIIFIRHPRQAIKLGIGYLPANRKENSILRDMSILDNASVFLLRRLSKLGFIRKASQRRDFASQRNALHIKMDEDADAITSLSGGNQQKVVFAKWISANPKLLILDNPTQGVDVEAKEEIYHIIQHLAERRVAIVVLTGEAQEIVRLCSRALVMYHGNLQGEAYYFRYGNTIASHSSKLLEPPMDSSLRGLPSPSRRTEFGI